MKSNRKERFGILLKNEKFHPWWDRTHNLWFRKSKTLVHYAKGASLLASRAISAFIISTSQQHFGFPSIPNF